MLLIGNLGSKIISFLMVPIYTSILSTAEYGTYDVLVTTESLLVPVISLDISESIFRFSMDKEVNQSDVLKTGFRVWWIGVFVVTAATLALSFFFPAKYCVFIFLAYLFHSLYSIAINYARAIEKMNRVAIAGVINTLAFCFFSFLFLVYIPKGLSGYMMAYVLGYIIPLIYLGIVLIKPSEIAEAIHLSFNKSLCHKMIQYSAPLIFAHIGWWIISSSDHYMVAWMRGAAENGVYSVGYKIPNILVSFMGVFSQVWIISAVKENDDHFNSNIYNVYRTSISLVCMILILFSEPIGKILYAKDFYSAWKVAPWLLIACEFQGLATFLCGILTSHKNSKGITVATLTGAVVNIVLNAIMIPVYGSIGAAYATMIAYFIVWLSLVYQSFRLTGSLIVSKEDYIQYIFLIGAAVYATQTSSVSYANCGLILVAFTATNWKLILRIFDKVKSVLKIDSNPQKQI